MQELVIYTVPDRLISMVEISKTTLNCRLQSYIKAIAPKLKTYQYAHCQEKKLSCQEERDVLDNRSEQHLILSPREMQIL